MWYQAVPWPFVALALGVILAGGAALLISNTIPGSSFVFFLAALCLISGLVGLLIHYKKEQRQLANAPEPPRIHVYHQAPCRIEQPLLDKLAKAEAILKQRVHDKQLEVDWTIFQHHHDLAETLKQQGQLQEAFREFCRSLNVLTEALFKQRNKEEVFQPVWDKTTG
jgi:hypothetical protein